MLFVNGLFMFFSFQKTIKFWLWLSSYLASIKTSMHKLCLSIFISWIHNRMVMCYISLNIINYKQLFLYIYGLVNIQWEIPLKREKIQFSLAKWFCCYLGISFTTFGNFLVIIESTKLSSEGIFQLWMETLMDWKVERNK